MENLQEKINKRIFKLALTGIVLVLLLGGFKGESQEVFYRDDIRLVNYWAENRSYSTTCAEEDNVNVPIFGSQVNHFRVVATHPTYCPCAYDGCPPDFSGCPPDGNGGTETCTTLWDKDGINVIEVCTLSDWWRPYSMNCVVDSETASCHYLRWYRKIVGENSFPQFLVLYEDGNMRLKPHPPKGIEDVCFGNSVIIGPAVPATRPYVDIQEVRVNPTAPSLDITYRNGETAHINLSVDRSQAVGEVEIGYSTSTGIPFATFRSMWVEDGNCDVDHIQSADGDFPILGSWTSLNGPWWFFYRKFWSKHNTSAPDIRIEVLPFPDIKVNGSDGPITLSQSDILNITVSLDNNGRTDNADWWLAADTPFGLFFFTFDSWTDAWVPGYQGPLFYLDSFEVFNMPVLGLPAGTYTLYFGVDIVMDGNVTWDSAYYDTVEVNIIDLLEKYAPVLKFNFDEQYFPTCIEEMKDWSVIKKYDAIGLDEVVFTSEVTCQKVKDYVDNSNLVVYFDLSDYYQYSFGRYTPTVYGRVVDSHKGGTIYLQYWFFYVRDNKPPPCAHEGDWEMITIELKELKNGTTQPIRVAYSRHLGGEVRPWSEVPWKIEGTHPFVYIAEKSHASYFESGTTFIPVIEEWDAHFGDGKVLAYRKIEALGPDVDVYNLVNINEEPHWCWINIPQLRWGSCSCPLGDGNDGPPSPVAQGDKKWSDPGAWMDSL